MLTPCCSNTRAYRRDSSMPEIGFERRWNKARLGDPETFQVAPTSDIGGRSNGVGCFHEAR